ncbi:hypothetical protein U3516DRAFT_743537 [Neocallimastix sp. 'constans']
MFADGTFYIAPIFGYQVFITRVFAPDINSFYTTSLSILNNKEQATYELLFEELKKNESKYNNNIIVTPKNFGSLEVQKNKLFNNEVEKESLFYNNYKRKIEGVWKKKRILTKTNEINDFIKKYKKKKESELIDIKCDKNDIIDLWYKCLIELNTL